MGSHRRALYLDTAFLDDDFGLRSAHIIERRLYRCCDADS